MDDGIEPQRTHDELMRIVVTRGRGLRMRRRRMMSLGAGGTVLLIALVTGLLTAGQRATETRVSAIASGPTTSVPVLTGASEGLGLHGPLDFPLPPFIHPMNTVVRPVPTTVAPAVVAAAGPVTTVPPVSVAPTGGGVAPVTTTTTAPPQLRECTRDQLAVEATTDKSLYLSTEKVILNSVIRNRSSEACGYAGYSFESVFTDGDGKPVTLKSALVADTFRLEPLSPGKTLVQTREWDQQACRYNDDGASSCSPAAPGTYKGSVRWSLPGGPYEATADFVLAVLPVGVR